MRVFRKTENKPERKDRAARGYTLMEMLVVIAIIVVLIGIVAIAASSIISSMKQNKLDTIAQDIYVAAQDRLTEMYTDNRADEVDIEKRTAKGDSTAGMYLLQAEDTTVKPKDWDNTNTYAGLNAMNNTEAAAASVLLPAGSLSAEVEANHWIIEYNPEYGYVYGVYYSEKGFTPAQIDTWYTSGTANKYRVFADRKGSGVGYYGGTGVLGGKVVMTNTSLNVSVNIINAEELKADISVKIPTQFKDRLLRLTMTFTGERSGTVTKKEVVLDAMNYGYFNRTYPITIDSFNMKSGKSQQFGQQELFQGMHPGENVTMEVFAELGEQGSGTFAPDAALDTARTTAVFNSLFHSVDTETSTAYVSAGRHLQNLNNLSASGIQSVEITNVVQVGNIDFKNTTDDVVDDTAFWWAETYPGRTFEPINNNRIVSMLGSGKDEENNTVYYIISGMTVDLDADGAPAGMFGTLGKTAGSVTVTDVSLVGSKVTGTGAVGALAGEAKGRLTMVNTGAYLTRDDYINKNYSTAGVALRGDTVGGLVGVVGSNVTATECYAAEILRGGSYAGGLFGRVDGTMELSRSYADCYLTAVGGSVGGLAGFCGSASTISSCYSAGFAIGMSEKSAGFVPSAVASVRNSYTVMNIGPNDTGTATVTTMFYTTVASCGNLANVYYARNDEAVYPEGKLTAIGEGERYSNLRNSKAPAETNLDDSGSFRFSSASRDTTAYNLGIGFGLTNYPYPFIYREDGRTVLHHYGDWDGNLFVPGTLVYFEEYSDGWRGYYGAGSNFLNSAKTVVRDGYALLYYWKDVEEDGYGLDEIAVAHYDGQSYDINPIDLNTDKKYTVTKRSMDGTAKDDYYYFRDLPTEIVNSPSAAVGNFYTFIQVNTPDTVNDENEGVSYYYFNPHFAATVEQVETAGSAKPTLASAAKNVVRVRTPRHLYLLSKYFSGHAGAMGYAVTLEQEMNLNYGSYHWTEAGFSGAVSVQAPIGSADTPFNATYDGKGYTITGVSFRSDTLYTGMFGYIGKNLNSSRLYGKLRNIFLVAEMNDNRSISFAQAPQEANNYAYAGTLAGANYGYISNCAVAGYGINLDTYNTTLYVGGLVGFNSGTITGCSAENPFITVRTNSANGYVGAFVGLNGGNGTISSACSVSSLDVSRYSSGSVRVGGFAGGNAGTVRRSYTVCAMSASNIQERDIDGFTLTGGSVQSCYFLTGGTYKFVGKVSAYDRESQTANPVTNWKQMPSLDGFGTISTKDNCDYYGKTQGATGEMAVKYPFATPVTRNGSYVFYGDWVTNDVFGDYGILYWEHEENGTNDGYHFYLVDCDGNKFSTLCTAHDDGGVITEYGYGYYRLKDAQDEVSKIKFFNVPENLDPYINDDAVDDLSAQFSNSYEFVLYDTSDAFADTPDGMYVTGENAHAWAEFTLTDSDSTKIQKFSFSPFFGATVQAGTEAPKKMEIRSIEQLQFLNWNRSGTQTVTEEKYEPVGGLTYSKIWERAGGKGDTRSTPYYYKSGDNYIPVSISRIQYWGTYYYTLTANNQPIGNENQYGSTTVTVTLYVKSTTTSTVPLGGNTKQLVDETNYRLFTYLGQTNHAGEEKATQGKKEAYNSTVFDWTWNQTHDIKQDASKVTSFTPIAAAATSSKVDSGTYDAILYAWFGSKYNGNSYKIEDVSITSSAFTVGLFGVTAGADMQNIIMYSENGATIERNTAANDPAGAYSLGGLIGVSYDYNNPDDNKSLQNCAIAGYNIVDNSKNKQTLGEANVGGLVGVSNGNLFYCSAVTKIQINCTHRLANGQGFTQADWGNFVRVGGLVGATNGTLSDCYTGGSILVSDNTLGENRNAAGTILGKTLTQQQLNNKGLDKQVVVSPDSRNGNSSTSVYIAGIGGSGFAQNYRNFSGYPNFREGSPKFINCYTYIDFPKLEGTIRSISIIGSLADRYYWGVENKQSVSISNCYYLDNIIKKDVMLSNVPNFSYVGTTNVSGTIEAHFEDMLSGNGKCENILFTGTERNCASTLSLTAKNLEEMHTLRPGGSWSGVTTSENGVTINGKYSFPAGDSELNGRNYPFATIVTQTSDATGETVHVHYGTWPKGNGLYSSESNITLDLLVEDADKTDVTLTNYVNYSASEITSLDDLTLRYSELQEDGTVRDDLETSEIVSVTPELRSDGTVKLAILGLKEGTVTIAANYGGNEAKIQVTVTADFSISVVPVTVTVENGQVTQVTEVTDLTRIPEAFQQDDLYWKLSGVNSEGTPIELTAENPENWRVEDNTVDENFDEYQFLTAKTGEVLLRFRSNEVKLHNVQVTAFNVPGVTGQTITGTRSREISFVIKKNPPTVTVFAYPRGTEGNWIVATLYQITDEAGNVGYYLNKTGGEAVTSLNAPTEIPVGYNQFQGYFLPAVGEEDPAAFTKEPDGDGKCTITYVESIENENNALTVYGSWTVAQFQAVFNPGYDSVTVVGVEKDADTSQYTMTYTMEDGITIPNVDPTEFEDAAQGRTAVFSGWKVSEETGNWSAGERFDAGRTLEKGRYGNVTFDAVWGSRYQIQYFQEDGTTAYEGVADKYTSYVGEAAEIPLFTPDVTEDGERIFIGWKLREEEPSTAVTGWEPGVIYKDSVTGVSCTGNVELVAQWGKSYTISYKNEEADFLTERYAEGGVYHFPAGPTAPAGYRFDCWKVTAVSEDAAEWELNQTYVAGEKLDNTQALYKGDVTLSAQWRKATYTITFNLEGGLTSDGMDSIEPIVYELGDIITMPSNLTKDECESFQWVVSYAEYDADEACFWKQGNSFTPGQKLTVDGSLYGNVTLTAQWTVRTYTIYYYPNGGTMTLEKPSDYYYVQVFTKASGLTFADAKRDGYTLSGWVQDEKLSDNAYFGTNRYAPGYVAENPTDDVHMVAQWAPIDYTIRFHYAEAEPGAEPIFTQPYTIESGDTLDALPILNGYTVAGWTTGNTVAGNWQANTEYTAGTSLNGMYGDVDLYCTRSAVSYDITYMSGESTVGTDAYTIESTVIIRDAPVANAVDGKAQFFTGWTAAPDEPDGVWTDGGVYQPGDKVGPGACGDVTLTAGFTFRTLTLSAGKAGETQYYLKDGYSGESFEAYFCERYNAPTKSGWTLDGWYTNNQGTGQKVLNRDGSIAAYVDGYTIQKEDGSLEFALTQDQTLYARWTKSVNAFVRVDYPTDGEPVMIGRQDENSLYLLTSTKKTSLIFGTYYEVGKESISSAASGYFYSDNIYDSNTMDWVLSGNSEATMIDAPNSTNEYLGRYPQYDWYGNITGWQLAIRSNTDNNWVIKKINDKEYTVYFTYAYNDDLVDTLCLNLSASGAGISKVSQEISLESQAISFYRIMSVEEVSYD